jgi:hypothetical protein
MVPSVVMVPENTGRNTSPAAILAASLIGTFPLAKIRCVFSITTMASSTTIPSASRKENSTIMFSVNPIHGITIKAIKHDNGTDKRHKYGVGCTHKKHQDNGYQYKTNNNGIDKVIKCCTGFVRLIAGYYNIQPFREYCFLFQLDQFVDLVRCLYQVLACPLLTLRVITFLNLGLSFVFKRA